MKLKYRSLSIGFCEFCIIAKCCFLNRKYVKKLYSSKIVTTQQVEGENYLQVSTVSSKQTSYFDEGSRQKVEKCSTKPTTRKIQARLAIG